MMSFGSRLARTRTNFLRRMELTAQHRQHVHSRMRLSFQQNRNIFAVYLHANGFLHRDRVGLVRGLLEHRCKPEKLAYTGSSTTTSWPSSSTVLTRTLPYTIT